MWRTDSKGSRQGLSRFEVGECLHSRGTHKWRSCGCQQWQILKVDPRAVNGWIGHQITAAHDLLWYNNWNEIRVRNIFPCVTVSLLNLNLKAIFGILLFTFRLPLLPGFPFWVGVSLLEAVSTVDELPMLEVSSWNPKQPALWCYTNKRKKWNSTVTNNPAFLIPDCLMTTNNNDNDQCQVLFFISKFLAIANVSSYSRDSHVNSTISSPESSVGFSCNSCSCCFFVAISCC